MRAKQRTAWIIGASSGIGGALAMRLARDDWQVIVSSRSADKLRAIRDAAPSNVRVRVVDINDRAAVRELAERLRSEEVDLDAVFINAGVYEPMAAEEFSYELFRDINQTNYLGAVAVLEAILPYLRQQGRGQVLITASVSGYRGLPYAAPYSATKAALINMAESLAPEVARWGVRLRVINPGFVKSPLTDKNEFSMPFLMEPEQAADCIARGLDKSGFEIVFPRRMGWTMKLLRILPYAAYFRLTRKLLR
jgi:NAD(P)-dependent dehydrogenase (short-subunit alcohol dehydrogenase family)